MAEPQGGQPSDPGTIREFEIHATSEQGAEQGPVVEYDPEAPPPQPVVAESLETADTIRISADWLAAQAELETRFGGADAFIASAVLAVSSAEVAIPAH